ncbi:Uncharacterized protein dnm_027610 [Desulfonema magnum]|uniref:Uncharacterized protein n=1 Tax=Desulfonema magnum TaxID=45655 RepID=A0A975BJI9_9BACT|nr:Uncharacterized protein dnm_027610 [Desulfonema magnum]
MPRPGNPNTVDLKSSGRIRSAKILFLQLRKSIFRTPERKPENLFSLKSTVLPGTPGFLCRPACGPEPFRSAENILPLRQIGN